MKLATNDVPVEFGGQVDQGEFRIKNSAVAFSILSSGLYSNKYKAILRELGCNAYDSHVEAGFPAKPFTVHLPTRTNPIFSVRDYGIGLSHEQVMNLYTTYFESTKNNSNDFVGCMGLGSKSPFSYTKNFTITAIKDGTKGVYSAFIGDRGVPNILQLTSEATDEHNGVEVSFAVESRNDMSQFKNEAGKVYRWFKHKPEITGEPLTIPEITYAEKDIIPGVNLSNKRDYNTKSYAVMGNVAYPINVPEGEKMPKGVHDLFNNNGFVVEFAIGELDIAASREELGYVPSTIAAIGAKGEAIIDALGVYVEGKLKPAKTKWDRNKLAKDLMTSNDKLFGTIIETYVDKHPRQFVKGTKKMYSRLTISVPEAEFAKVDGLRWAKKVVRRSYNSDNLTLANVNTDREEKPAHLKSKNPVVGGQTYNPNDYWKVHTVDASDTAIVFNDDKGNVLQRIRNSYLDPTYKDLFGGNKDLLIFQAQNKKINKDVLLKFIKGRFPGAPVVLASSLAPLDLSVGNNGNQRVTVQRFTARRTNSYSKDSYTFFPLNGKLKDIEPTIEKGKKKTFLYLKLSHKSILKPFADGTNPVWDANTMYDLLENSNIANITGIDLNRVYGVNKTSLETVTKSSQWVDFFDYIEKAFDAIDWTSARAETEHKIIGQQFEHSDYDMKSVDKPNMDDLAKNETSIGRMFKKWLDWKGNVPAVTNVKKGKTIEYDMLVRVMQNFFPNKDFTKTSAKLDVSAIEKEYEKVFEEVKTTYPMLRHLTLDDNRRYDNTGNWQDAIDYIKLVDSAK